MALTPNHHEAPQRAARARPLLDPREAECRAREVDGAGRGAAVAIAGRSVW
jgi:hypothetical protein